VSGDEVRTASRAGQGPGGGLVLTPAPAQPGGSGGSEPVLVPGGPGQMARTLAAQVSACGYQVRSTAGADPAVFTVTGLPGRPRVEVIAEEDGSVCCLYTSRSQAEAALVLAQLPVPGHPQVQAATASTLIAARDGTCIDWQYRPPRSGTAGPDQFTAALLDHLAILSGGQPDAEGQSYEAATRPAPATVAGEAGQSMEPRMCRARLADALAKGRRERGLTQRQAGSALEWSGTKMARTEAGTAKITVADLRAALDLYQVSDPGERERLEMLARAGRRRPWYSQHPVTSPELGYYLDAERSAAAISGYRIRAVPGLLQTPEYARAVLAARDMDRAGERAALLAARQELLCVPSCPVISFVLDEAVLRRPVGGPAVLAAQLDRLRQAAAHPRITIRVVPFTVAVPPAGDLTVLTFPGGAGLTWQDTADGRHVPCSPAAERACRRQAAELRSVSVPLEAL